MLDLRFQVESRKATRLHIIISDDVFDASGSLVEAMRVFQGHRHPSPEAPTMRPWSTRHTAGALTNRGCSPVRVALLELGVQPPVNLIIGERCVRIALTSFRPILSHVDPPQSLNIDWAASTLTASTARAAESSPASFSTGVVIINSQDWADIGSRQRPDRVSSSRGYAGRGSVGASPPARSMEDTILSAKEKFRLLTLQTLKYSNVWLLVSVSCRRAG